MNRAYGVLLHISSLPSPYGIGSLGAAAHDFLDFLQHSGARVWQVLPVGPTGYGDSPYQALSSYAGNPYFIDLDLLCADGLLSRADLPATPAATAVDYGALYKQRLPLLRRAFDRALPRDAQKLAAFVQAQGHWLPDYALFMAAKGHFGGAAWLDWPDADLRLRKPSALAHYAALLVQDVAFWQYVQYLFYSQWEALRTAAHQRGIRILGDLPIYAALDSADVWSHPEVFWLDDHHLPVRVAGCPPDGFSPEGQLWGNPLYDWDALARQGYAWWTRRIQGSAALFDSLRLDHFRGFEAYYAIPYSAATAAQGEWLPGPGLPFFAALAQAAPDFPIIAEDLGALTPAVARLLADTGYPGMKMLLFAFDSCGGDNPYLPHNHLPHGVVYTGTHDNDTAAGWYAAAPPDVREYAAAYLGCTKDPAAAAQALVRAAFASPCTLAILPLQDLLGLGSEARMNTPSTAQGNWTWRVAACQLTPALAAQLRQQAGIFLRLG